ncbi:hypothetical protein DDB_G0286821 [Dictyostelium discoideum AX4]|uniref:Uncharacterized protein n=1 Tax=Dictyostelium discoideum TaxID=44689 RepID=Q54LA7_DICDI|nr:hypothetical protein DDB_G0286821 [Dictyostelium discoideum AX4]EAL64166.1 hypothetical protein DDB_G0286821 [Dictyostelium discoideum AX4]|eukprot:XP_637654.1 hypothetical protein DDB_G0286821 [Dictyostelium discoideum AX4]
MEFTNYKYFNQVFEYITKNYQNKTNDFLKNLKNSENETFNKLLVSIIREKLLPFINDEINLKENQTNNFKFNCGDNSIKEISFEIEKVFGFSFFTFKKPIYYNYYTERNQTILNSTLELIEILKQNPSFNDIEVFKSEIVNSITNMALITTLCSDDLNKIKKLSIENNWNYLSDYVDAQFKKDKTFDKFLFYDQIHLSGHHIHPSFKLRLGLNHKQVIQYSYELKKEIPIRFIGLNKSVARFDMINDGDGNGDGNGDDNPTSYFFKLFPNLKELIINYFKVNQGLNIDNYIIYPMFPYQITDTFPIQFKNEIENKELIIIPEELYSIKSFQTSSLRNLIPVIENNNNPPHIKFSVPIQTTNFVRFMPNDFIPVGTSVSKILKRIKEIEFENFNNKIVFLNEIGGIYHKNDTELKYQNFAIIWKENTNLFLKSNDDHPISSCSLFNQSPICESSKLQTILGEIIKKYNEFNISSSSSSTIISNDDIDHDGFKNSILNWFKLYCKLLIEPSLILLTKYGISLESHLQNSVYVYVKGEPKLLILKDWSGIVIKMDRILKHKQLIGENLINSIPKLIQLSDLEFYKMFSHSILHNHICQIIIGICKEFPNHITETQLWFECYQIMKNTFNLINNQDISSNGSGGSDSGSGGTFKNDIENDENELFKKELKVKALTGMRLLTKNQILLPFNVKNPLNQFI